MLIDRKNYSFALDLVAPEIAPFVLSENPSNWGQTVTATCTVLQGDQPVQIEWALNGKSISHEYPDVSIATTKRVSLLTIEAVTASHAGEYTCIASNVAGGTSYTATLAVNGIIDNVFRLYVFAARVCMSRISSWFDIFLYPSFMFSYYPFLILLLLLIQLLGEQIF